DTASDTIRYLSDKFIRLPDMFMKEQVVRDNPGIFKDSCLINYRTSIDSLSPDAPIFPVMLQAQRGPTVVYHNIVSVIPQKSILGKTTKTGDGVVAYESAHMEDVASEIVVQADHVNVHRH